MLCSSGFVDDVMFKHTWELWCDMCIPKKQQERITAETLHQFQTNFAKRCKDQQVHRDLHWGQSLLYTIALLWFVNVIGLHPPHTQFYGSLDFVWDNPGKPVPEETSQCPLIHFQLF